MATFTTMFERPHHKRIGQILSLLNGPYLRELNCWFGGGTAMVLRAGEYRESLDIDLMISDLAGYRTLRTELTGSRGVLALMPAEQVLVTQNGDVRADQYGIRTRLSVDAQPIKFEIVLEGRISFDIPPAAHAIAGITMLTTEDLLASKLLANSDRWADDGTFSRDVLDMAMSRPTDDEFRQALIKSEGAYGNSIRRDLGSALERMFSRDGRLQRCLRTLQFSVPPGVVWKNLRYLESLLDRA